MCPPGLCKLTDDLFDAAEMAKNTEKDVTAVPDVTSAPAVPDVPEKEVADTHNDAVDDADVQDANDSSGHPATEDADGE